MLDRLLWDRTRVNGIAGEDYSGIGPDLKKLRWLPGGFEGGLLGILEKSTEDRKRKK